MLLLEIKIAVFVTLLLKKEPSQIPPTAGKIFRAPQKQWNRPELFWKEQYKVMVTDEDASSEARIKSQVNPDIEKWSDINHVMRILGKLLYEAKTTNFGPKNDRLTDQVRENIVKSFGIALMENKGDVEGMQLAITSIVPHAFGEHDSCGKWCTFHEDPAAYRRKHLPGGESLQGDGLRAFLTESIQAFCTNEYVKKLVNLGSTQRNENLNHVIASKSLEVRYYGGSKSNDFRTAAGVAQCNESHSYLVSVSETLGHTTCADLLGHYVGKKNVKRLQQTRRQNTDKFRRNRKIKKQERRSKAKKVEESEGITYESGIGLSDPELLAL